MDAFATTLYATFKFNNPFLTGQYLLILWNLNSIFILAWNSVVLGLVNYFTFREKSGGKGPHILDFCTSLYSQCSLPYYQGTFSKFPSKGRLREFQNNSVKDKCVPEPFS